jgi:hypothetical protein
MKGAVMRSRFIACLVLGIGMLSAGCYEATFPLDRAPQADLPAGVTGSWRCLPADPHETDEAITVTVKRAGDRIYDVTLLETDQEPDRYQAYASVVNAATVINLKDLDPASSKPWVFLRTSFLRPNVLAIQVLSETAVGKAEASPAGIRKVLERPSETAFEDVSVCVRAKAP